jgi:uncharacterized RDD family membrane protein YckC
MSSPNAPAGDTSSPEYVGFWERLGASIIDSVLAMLVVAPLWWWAYGKEFLSELATSYAPSTALLSSQSLELARGPVDVLLSYVFPAIAVVVFWITRQATPGKMLLGMRIVDAKTGGPLSTGQAIGRYLGYYLSIFGLFLGFIWVAFDARKQGWHDKLAGTVVVRARKR